MGKLLCTTLCVGLLSATLPAESLQILVGCNGDKSIGAVEGIYQIELNSETGEISDPRLLVGTKQPSFLHYATPGGRKILYAVEELNEVVSLGGRRSGALQVYSYQQNGDLNLEQRISSEGGSPCHISMDPSQSELSVANYMGGSVASYQVLHNGKLRLNKVAEYEGSSVSPRQKASHAHGVHYSGDGNYRFVCDLGTDKVHVTGDDGAEVTVVSMKPGSGPRHLLTHPSYPDGRIFYVLHELSSQLEMFQLDVESGGYASVKSLSTLKQENPINNASELIFHPNGKFLYTGNRGEDTIAVFQLDSSSYVPRLKYSISTQGSFPRHMCFSDDGLWLLVANQLSNTLAAFAVDPDTGVLFHIASFFSLPRPRCGLIAPKVEAGTQDLRSHEVSKEGSVSSQVDSELESPGVIKSFQDKQQSLKIEQVVETVELER